MGLFKRKQKPKKNVHHDDVVDTEQQLFDEYYREELRNHGRWYFEKVINENAALLKEDLDLIVAQVKTDVKEHIAKTFTTAISEANAQIEEYVKAQLDVQFSTHQKTLKDAQDSALKSMITGSQTLQAQHEHLTQTLEKSIENQETAFNKTLQENLSRVAALKDTHDAALKTLITSVRALQAQHKEMGEVLDKNVAQQEAMLITAFQDNMSQVIEHYLLNTLGDQYDMKAQLPSIIQQMEEKKQAIADDMKL